MELTAPNNSQPFWFLDLPKELRLMVYEQVLTRSHVVTDAKRTLKVTLISRNPIPPGLRALVPGSWTVHEASALISDTAPGHFRSDQLHKLANYCSFADTLLNLLLSTREGHFDGYDMLECQGKLYAFAKRFFEGGTEDVEYSWIQSNLKAVTKWCIGFIGHFIYTKNTKGLLLEIVFSGSHIGDQDFRIFLRDLDIQLLADHRVHMYEVTTNTKTPCRECRETLWRAREGDTAQVDYKDAIDEEMWDSNRA